MRPPTWQHLPSFSEQPRKTELLLFLLTWIVGGISVINDHLSPPRDHPHHGVPMLGGATSPSFLCHHHQHSHPHFLNLAICMCKACTPHYTFFCQVQCSLVILFFTIIVVHNCTIFLCSLDVRNICRGPNVKEKDHLDG